MNTFTKEDPSDTRKTPKKTPNKPLASSIKKPELPERITTQNIKGQSASEVAVTESEFNTLFKNLNKEAIAEVVKDLTLVQRGELQINENNANQHQNTVIFLARFLTLKGLSPGKHASFSQMDLQRVFRSLKLEQENSYIFDKQHRKLFLVSDGVFGANSFRAFFGINQDTANNLNKVTGIQIASINDFDKYITSDYDKSDGGKFRRYIFHQGKLISPHNKDRDNIKDLTEIPDVLDIEQIQKITHWDRKTCEKFKTICKDNHFSEGGLLKVFSVETDGNFLPCGYKGGKPRPDLSGRITPTVGLIQWTKGGITRNETSKIELAKMTAEEQLDKVAIYFDNRIKNLIKVSSNNSRIPGNVLYQVVAAGDSFGKDDNFTLYQKGKAAWRKNFYTWGHAQNDGITVGDIKSWFDSKSFKGLN